MTGNLAIQMLSTISMENKVGVRVPHFSVTNPSSYNKQHWCKYSYNNHILSYKTAIKMCPPSLVKFIPVTLLKLQVSQT